MTENIVPFVLNHPNPRKLYPSVVLTGKGSKNERSYMASRSFIFWPIGKIRLQKKVGSKILESFEIWNFEIWNLKILKSEIWNFWNLRSENFEIWKFWNLRSENFEIWNLKVWKSEIWKIRPGFFLKTVNLPIFT